MFGTLVPISTLQKILLLANAERVLAKIPVKKLKAEDKEVQTADERCAICIGPYEVSETLRSLPCSHGFHKKCIDPWLLENYTCPICKMDIMKYYDHVFWRNQHSLLRQAMEQARSRESTAPNPVVTSDNSQEEAGSESHPTTPDELVAALVRTSVSPRNMSGSDTSSPSGSQQEAASSSTAQEAASSSTAQDSAGASRDP